MMRNLTLNHSLSRMEQLRLDLLVIMVVSGGRKENQKQ